MKGTISIHQFRSRILKGNPLGDSHIRDVVIYLPPSYKASNSKGYVTIFYLPGYGSRARSILNIDPFSESIHDRMNRLISKGRVGEMILVHIDCFTKLGGNQYVNSTAIGNYEDYIVKEIIPYIDNKYNCQNRVVFGKSSGGYGSIMLGAHHPEVFNGVVDHSGDAGFEYSCIPEFPRALSAFRDAGGPKNWWKKFWKSSVHGQKDLAILNVMCMAASYSPNPLKQMGIEFPFDLKTGEILKNVWRKWLSCDPARSVRKYKKKLEKLKLIYIDCGTKDEFNLIWGARMIHSELKELSINHFYEEFDGGHLNTGYRHDISLQKVYTSFS
ncbi:MAG TPA: alpha/beta hydrolase-fold protein [Nitrososphaeraceae archaeon]